MKDSKTKAEESTRLTYTGLRHSCCRTYLLVVHTYCRTYILRCVSFAEVGRVCRVALREPMHLCTCVSEEEGDEEAAFSEMPSLLSYTLRCVNFAEVGRVCRVALREPMHLCTCVSEEGGDGEAARSDTLYKSPSFDGS